MKPLDSITIALVEDTHLNKDALHHEKTYSVTIQHEEFHVASKPRYWPFALLSCEISQGPTLNTFPLYDIKFL